MIEGRWKAVLLCKLKEKGAMRFNQIIKEVDAISPRMLTKQLKELERDQLINRKAYYEIPPRVEYSLTTLGETLIPVLSAIAQWGLQNRLRNFIKIREE
jgi:DNA-binding HxlR family transcriptional regulator